jgi:antitoxin Phd
MNTGNDSDNQYRDVIAQRPTIKHARHLANAGKSVVVLVDDENGALGSASSWVPICILRRAGIYDYSSHIWRRTTMREIQLKDAKATLSSVVDDAVRGKPAIITRHGKREAVVVGFKEWERLANVPSFGQLLMSAPVSPGDLPSRNRTPIRRVKL